MNVKIITRIVLIWAAILVVLAVFRKVHQVLRHVRKLANLSNDSRQRYFSIPNEKFALIKRRLINSPLVHKRHSREFRLSPALNMGALPTRLQTQFLVAYTVLNIVHCTISIDWHNSETFYEEGRNRCGTLAVLNMVPLFLLVGRSNPLIEVTGISFDTCNLLHRWLGRIVVCEAVAHGAFFVAGTIAAKGDQGWFIIQMAIKSSTFILAGVVALCTFVALLLHSPSVIRHAFYETFLTVHIALAVVATIAVSVHLKELPHRLFLLCAVLVWVLERASRFVMLVRRNVGPGMTKAEVEALPGDAVRVTLRILRPWKFQPGQHIYLYMPTVGLWTSHPFSLAWSDEQPDFYSEKALPISRQDIIASKKLEMSLIIRRRTGFTDKIFRKAESSPGGKFTTTAFVEGPYGEQNFRSYGTVMLFAAGVGITHQVPHVRDLVSAYAAGTCATRQILLVWIIQSPEHLEWIRPWMTQILGMERRRDVLRIQLFITRPRSTREIHSPSASVQMFPGKPDVGALIQKEQERQVGAMAVSVCGTGGLADDVRKATLNRCQKTAIDFYEEAFSW